MIRRPPRSTLFPYTTLSPSLLLGVGITMLATIIPARRAMAIPPIAAVREGATLPPGRMARHGWLRPVTAVAAIVLLVWGDRKSTRLNSSHANISYAVFCLKK